MIALYKILNSKRFGGGQLYDFLIKHGAEENTHPRLNVPVKAFVAALDNPEEAGLKAEELTLPSAFVLKYEDWYLVFAEHSLY